jgi:APA family basic amino acid/polyamine antiporter
VSVAAVAVGWGGYLQSLLDSQLGIGLPDSIAGPPSEGGEVNVPAALLVLGVAALLVAGVRESARTHTAMVFLAVGILVFFILVGFASIDGDSFSPWASNGVQGPVDAAARMILANYALYGRTHSRLQRGAGADDARPELA